MHPFHRIVGRNGCIALHYYVRFFTNFLYRHSWDRKLVQDLYGHHSVCVMPNPLAKIWESNLGPFLCMPLVLPSQPYKILYQRPSLPIPRVTDLWNCGTEWVHRTTGLIKKNVLSARFIYIFKNFWVTKLVLRCRRRWLYIFHYYLELVVNIRNIVKNDYMIMICVIIVHFVVVLQFIFWNYLIMHGLWSAMLLFYSSYFEITLLCTDFGRP